MTKSKHTAEDIQFAHDTLHKLLGNQERPVIYTVLRHVSKSGMQRVISCYVIENNKPLNISFMISCILAGAPMHKKWTGNVVGGCGMDMGYHIVNSLSTALYCKEGYTHEGAYKLKHEWM